MFYTWAVGVGTLTKRLKDLIMDEVKRINPDKPLTELLMEKCKECHPDFDYPGKLIRIVPGCPDPVCAVCGRSLMETKENYYREKLKRWDTYYHSICQSVASKSPCLSRQIGSILVKDKIIVATGFNGPPRGYPHCQNECPRKSIEGYKSGKFLDQCPATHAEANCIASAARIGAPVTDCTLYLNYIIPCKDCMSLIINAGIKEVVCEKAETYHYMSLEMAKYANIKIREFIL